MRFVFVSVLFGATRTRTHMLEAILPKPTTLDVDSAHTRGTMTRQQLLENYSEGDYVLRGDRERERERE